MRKASLAGTGPLRAARRTRAARCFFPRQACSPTPGPATPSFCWARRRIPALICGRITGSGSGARLTIGLLSSAPCSSSNNPSNDLADRPRKDSDNRTTCNSTSCPAEQLCWHNASLVRFVTASVKTLLRSNPNATIAMVVSSPPAFDVGHPSSSVTASDIVAGRPRRTTCTTATTPRHSA